MNKLLLTTATIASAAFLGFAVGYRFGIARGLNTGVWISREIVKGNLNIRSVEELRASAQTNRVKLVNNCGYQLMAVKDQNGVYEWHNPFRELQWNSSWAVLKYLRDPTNRIAWHHVGAWFNNNPTK